MTRLFADYALRSLGPRVDSWLRQEDQVASLMGYESLEKVPFDDMHGTRTLCDRCATSVPNLHLGCGGCGWDLCVRCVEEEKEKLVTTEEVEVEVEVEDPNPNDEPSDKAKGGLKERKTRMKLWCLNPLCSHRLLPPSLDPSPSSPPQSPPPPQPQPQPHSDAPPPAVNKEPIRHQKVLGSGYGKKRGRPPKNKDKDKVALKEGTTGPNPNPPSHSSPSSSSAAAEWPVRLSRFIDDARLMALRKAAEMHPSPSPPVTTPAPAPVAGEQSRAANDASLWALTLPPPPPPVSSDPSPAMRRSYSIMAPPDAQEVDGVRAKGGLLEREGHYWIWGRWMPRVDIRLAAWKASSPSSVSSSALGVRVPQGVNVEDLFLFSPHAESLKPGHPDFAV